MKIELLALWTALLQGSDPWADRMAKAGEEYSRNDFEAAERTITGACAALDSLALRQRAQCFQALCVLKGRRGAHAEALVDGGRAIAAWKQLGGADAASGEAASAYFNVGALHQELMEWAQAEPYLREALRRNQALFAAADPEGRITATLTRLGAVLGSLGELDEAERLLRAALDRERGPGRHGGEAYLASAGALGELWLHHGRYAEALALLREAESASRLSPARSSYGDVLVLLAMAYRVNGQPERGLPLAKRGLAIHQAEPRPDPALVAAAMRELAFQEASARRWGLAIGLLDRAATFADQAFGAGSAVGKSLLEDRAKLVEMRAGKR